MHKRFLHGRIDIAKFRGQFFVLPTFGEAWESGRYKFSLCAAWLLWGIAIGCGRRK